uniref:F-box domain-containing protein n=1 Tax=Triticum urartu TaxID=4572 RepID=A0A8R7VB04_TRIUA
MPPPWQPSTYAAGTIVAAPPCRSSSPAGFHASPDSDPLSFLSDEEKTIGDTSTAAPPISLDDEFPKATSMGWSDLPIDLLIRILHLLELPEALAFHAVCPSWRSASVAAGGAPPRRTPWLVSLAEEPPPAGDQQRRVRRRLCDPAATSELRNLLDAERTFQGVYGDEGKIVGYRYGCYMIERVHDVQSLGGYFYDKVVLSGPPSTCRTVALVIHLDGKRLSFARIGDTYWQQVSVIRRNGDSFADCIYHRGRFYAVTMEGILKSWDFSGSDKPRKKPVIAEDDNDMFDDPVITRYLLSTPWGNLLQVRVFLDTHQGNNVRIEIDRLDLKSQTRVALSSGKALRGHAAFVGQNSPGILSTKEFPKLRPDCIYFTTPRLRERHAFEHRCNQWSGVKVYDLKRQTLEDAFPSGGGLYGTICPLEVWFTPSLI